MSDPALLARARARKYYLANKDLVIKRAAAWAKSNPDRRREIVDKHNYTPSAIQARIRYAAGRRVSQ